MTAVATPLVDSATRKVVNLVMIDPESTWTPPAGQMLGPIGGNIGDTLNGDGVTYAAPAVPTPTAAQITANIRAEYARRITAALGDALKQASLQREATALLNKVRLGQVLTDVEAGDAVLLDAINTWEGTMIDAREALIAAGDMTYASDAHWPPAPVGVTATWLAGY